MNEEAARQALRRTRQRVDWAVTPEMQMDAVDAMRAALRLAEKPIWRRIQKRLGWSDR